MLDFYANQDITLKAKGTVDAFNQATYTTSTIKGRLQYKRTIVRNAQGQEVVSESQIFTKSAVVPDDLITVDAVDFPVITVEKPVGLDGTVMWYEVYL
jgi:hypothetical protein